MKSNSISFSEHSVVWSSIITFNNSISSFTKDVLCDGNGDNFSVIVISSNLYF